MEKEKTKEREKKGRLRKGEKEEKFKKTRKRGKIQENEEKKKRRLRKWKKREGKGKTAEQLIIASLDTSQNRSLFLIFVMARIYIPCKKAKRFTSSISVSQRLRSRKQPRFTRSQDSVPKNSVFTAGRVNIPNQYTVYTVYGFVQCVAVTIIETDCISFNSFT